MALFGQNRGLGKIIRIVAFVAALSAACSKKNDEFVGLVAKGDRSVASQIVDHGGRLFDSVNAALNRINVKLRSWKLFVDYWKLHPTPVGSAEQFRYYRSFGDQLADQLWTYQENFKGGKYTNEFSVELRSLEDAGLEQTAKQLRLELVNLHINLDDAFAYRIKETVDAMLPVLNEKLTEPESMYVREVIDAIKKYKVIELLKKVADKASRAGYEKTAEAANRAILALQAAMK